LLAPVFDPKAWNALPVATKGLPASPGAASGQAVFTANAAVEWTRQGKKVVLVRKETVPDDIHGMFVSQGILTATGGMTSHAAVVGRQMGKPSIVGAGALEIAEAARTFFGEGRIPIVQRMILAEKEDDRRKALAELLPMQRGDFYGVFKAMHGCPVTIRTIDPPLHEFLPKREDLMVDIARLEAKGQ